MTELVTKFYAQFADEIGRLPEELPEIEFVQDAIDYGTKHGMTSFEIIKVNIPADRHLKRVPNEHFSYYLTGDTEKTFHLTGDRIRHFIGINKILTGADLAARYDTKIKELEAKEQDQGTLALLDKYDRVRILWLSRSRGLYGAKDTNREEFPEFDYPEIEAGDIAYNKQGQKIWPKPSAPAAGARPSAPRV
jgi:hypothetical protein